MRHQPSRLPPSWMQRPKLTGQTGRPKPCVRRKTDGMLSPCKLAEEITHDLRILAPRGCRKVACRHTDGLEPCQCLSEGIDGAPACHDCLPSQRQATPYRLAALVTVKVMTCENGPTPVRPLRWTAAIAPPAGANSTTWRATLKPRLMVARWSEVCCYHCYSARS